MREGGNQVQAWGLRTDTGARDLTVLGRRARGAATRLTNGRSGDSWCDALAACAYWAGARCYAIALMCHGAGGCEVGGVVQRGGL